MPRHAKKTGRPEKPIDWERVDRLCAVQCTAKEIAADQNISVDTLENKIKASHNMSFSEYFDIKRQGGFSSLRHKMYENAMRGSNPLQIFLAKNWLGMAEKIEQTSANTTTVKISTEDRQSILEDIEAAKAVKADESKLS